MRKIIDISKPARKISPEYIVKELGAEEVTYIDEGRQRALLANPISNVIYTNKKNKGSIIKKLIVGGIILVGLGAMGYFIGEEVIKNKNNPINYVIGVIGYTVGLAGAYGIIRDLDTNPPSEVERLRKMKKNNLEKKL